MIMYKAGGWKNEVSEVDVLRKTDKSVWIMGVNFGKRKPFRESRFGRYGNYFDTWEQARSYILMRAKAKLSQAESGVETWTAEVAKIGSMRP